MWLFCFGDWFRIFSCCVDERSGRALAGLVVIASGTFFFGDDWRCSMSVGAFAHEEVERDSARNTRSHRGFRPPCGALARIQCSRFGV